MVGLHGTGLQDVGIDGSLRQEADAGKLAGLFLEHADELCANHLALLLGIGHAGKFVQKAVGGIYIHQVGLELVTEHADHLLGLSLAQQAVVQMHGYELLPHCLDEQGGHHRRIYAAGKGQQHLLVPNLSLQLLNLFLNEFLRQRGRSDALHIGGADIVCTHKFVICYNSVLFWQWSRRADGFPARWRGLS